MWDNGKEHRFLHKKSFKPKLVMGKDVRGLVVTEGLSNVGRKIILLLRLSSIHIFIFIMSILPTIWC